MMHFQASMMLAYHAMTVLLAVICFRRLRRWPYLYALLTWPGTVAHELLHFIAGLLTGAEPVGLSVTPKQQQDGTWQLGQVSFTRLRWWNSIPVGLAPMLLLPVGGWLFFYSCGLPFFSAENVILKLVVVQCLLCGWPSPQDFKHALQGLLMIAIISISIGWAAVQTGLINW